MLTSSLKILNQLIFYPHYKIIYTFNLMHTILFLLDNLLYINSSKSVSSQINVNIVLVFRFAARCQETCHTRS